MTLQTEWRLIPIETHSAFMNMALDEACAHAIAMGQVNPTIRFYRWKPSAVSIGYFQSLAQEVDVNACVEQKVDVVRRRTGGGAVYHDYDGEITYSVIAPEKLFPSNIIESYRHVAEWILNGLKKVGIEGEFVPINDIVVNGKKISGNAQTRRNGILQMHGTILCDVDVEKMFSLLKVPNEKMKGKMIETIKERVTSLKQLGVNNNGKVYTTLRESFLQNKKFTEGKWTKDEIEKAGILSMEKYAHPLWNGMR
ncbi:MAG: lipoate--protein ligase family protein [Candidatus Diapherotrites archaeon]